MPDAQTLLIVSEPISSGTPTAERDLARRDVARTRLHDLADHGVVDLLGLDARALERRRGGHHSELDGRARGERAAETSERRARGGEDDCVGHGGRVSPEPRQAPPCRSRREIVPW